MEERKLIEETALVAIPDKAREILVTDDESLNVATSFLSSIKGIRKRIAEECDPVIKKAHEVHKEAIAQKKRFEAPLLEGEKIVKKAIGGFLDERARIVREAEEKAQKERDESERLKREKEAKALAEAEKAEEEGKPEEAAKILDEAQAEIEKPIESAPVPEVTKAGGGVSSRQVWKFEITNAEAVPRELCSPDERKIKNALVSTAYMKAIPGVRAYTETVVSARAS